MELKGEELSDGCTSTPRFPDDYAAGKEAGSKLTDGLIGEYVRLYIVEKPRLDEAEKKDLYLGQIQFFNFISGMKCADPTDVHINMQSRDTATGEIDVPAERLASQVLLMLNQFSTHPASNYINLGVKTEPKETAEAAAQKISSYLADPLIWTTFKGHPTMREDFIADFNRRRQKDNNLPDFEAFLDPDDKLVKIRHVIHT